MRSSPIATLIFTLMVCAKAMATGPYEVKDIRLGGNLLEAYQTLKARYGDSVAVKQWRRHDTETVSLIASRDYCGSSGRTGCEQMTVSSILPLYRERVVRIELNQTFLRRRSEQEVVDTLLHKYGPPFLDRKNTRRRFLTREIVWCANSKVAASQVPHADSWIDYRALKANFVVTRFNIESDGNVSGLTIVSENQDLQQRNHRAMQDDGERFKQALINKELTF